MFQRQSFLLIILVTIFLSLTSCDLFDETINDPISVDQDSVTHIVDLVEIENFRSGALEHILEGEINHQGQAVGYHYDRLPTKKGEIISGSQTEPNDHGVYEAKVSVNDIEKTANAGLSTFFPDEWDTQDVVDAINEAYDTKTFISGNTYEGLTDEGIIIRMYLDDKEKIISAFPIY